LAQLDLADGASMAAFVLAHAGTRLPQSPAAMPPDERSDGVKLGLTPEAIFAEALISSRQNILPRRLSEPGPSAAQIEQLFRAAACAPDHGELRPWRFVLVPANKRADLAEVFAQALRERDASATPEQIESAREKAHRAPLLMLVVACLGPREPAIPMLERMVSVGCAIQNILLSAHSMAFGAGLTSGQAMASPHMRSLFQLLAGEEAVCFLNVGTTSKRKVPRLRPDPAAFVTSL
jgi:nitroreductase